MKDKIITWECFPPIPTNRFDYAAYWDGWEEDGPYGWGASKEEAIKNLKDMYELPKKNGKFITEWGE